MIEVFFWLSGLIGVGATVPYVMAAMKGESTPNSITWGVWSLKGVLMVLSLWELGATASLALPIAFATGRIAIFLVSLRHLKRSNVGFFPEGLCVSGALVAALILLTGQSAFMAMMILLAMDVLGFIPTMVRVWRGQQREDAISWFLFTLAGILALVSAAPYRFEDVIFPIWVLVTCVVILPKALGRHPAQSVFLDV